PGPHPREDRAHQQCRSGPLRGRARAHRLSAHPAKLSSAVVPLSLHRDRCGHHEISTEWKDYPMTQDNDVVIQAWNTVLFDKFCRFRHLLTDGLSVHSDEALARHGFPEAA